MIRECPFANNPQLVGDPVDTYSGAVVERQRDFRLAGPLPLEWFRVYNSQQSDKVFALGRGQSHEFACTLKFELDGIRWQGPLGQAVHFPPLLKDGQSEIGGGKRLTRLSQMAYRLHENKQPVQEFVFADPKLPAQLRKLTLGKSQILLSYNKQNQLESITDSLENELMVEFNNQGCLTLIFFPETKFRKRRTIVRYEYDQRSNIELVTDLYGNSLKYAYDNHNRMVGRTDRNGHTFVYKYDELGRCIYTSGIDGVLENRLEYEIPKECVKVTQGNGAVKRLRYQLGKLVSIEEPLGGTRNFVYDDQGRLAQESYGTNVTTSIYDSDGALVAKQDVLGHIRAFPEDLNEGDPLAHRVALNAAEFEFGRLVNVESASASVKPEPQSKEQGQRPSTYVEEANLYSSNSFGFVSGVNWWPKPETGRKFDLTGNMFQQVNRRGDVRRWVYDANGNIVKYVDFDGGVWMYGYRSWNHLVEESNPLGISKRMEYDSQENLTSFVDGGGTKTEYVHDLEDRVTEVKRHGQTRETYQRDSLGNLVSKYASDGRKLLDLEYGVGNLLTKRVLSSGGEHAYSYDPNGRYLSAETSRDSVEFDYDKWGNRCLEKRNGAGVCHTFRSWRRFGVSVWLDKFACRYQQERDGTLAITDPTGGKHRLRFTKSGGVERIFSNGTREVVKYDDLGRCESKIVSKAGKQNWNRTYRWSGEGELREIDDSANGKTSYRYDAAHRIKSRVSGTGKTDEFRFDNANNLTRLPSVGEIVLQSGNRLLHANGESFEYNDRNHIGCRKSSGNEVRYSYDSRDQLVKVESKDRLWVAEYDALGRRVRKTVNGLTTEYLWNTDQLAGEISPDGRLRLYVYSDALALTPMMFVEYDSVDSKPQDGACYFIFSDQIGTPVRVEDGTGNIVWQARIEPFGEALLSPDNRIEFNLRFPGHYWDKDIELNYNRFRYYDPRLARYVQSDPIGLAGGDNLYAYPSNPLLDVDTRGLECPKCGKTHGEGECPADAEKKPEPKPVPASKEAKDAAVADMVQRFGMPEAQARLIVEQAMSRGSGVVVGGSRVRGDNRPNSDLDLGYTSLKPSLASKVNGNIAKGSTPDKIPNALPIDPHHPAIVPGNETKSIPKIQSPEEFFNRSGTRQPPDARAGQPITPSGSVTYNPDGSISKTSPTGEVTPVRGPVEPKK